MALLLACGDGEERAEVYGCAADRQQASIVFNVAADMVRMCPALSKRVKILDSQKRLIYQPTGSIYQVLSADARMQPLYFLITTVGNDTKSICYVPAHQGADETGAGKENRPRRESGSPLDDGQYLHPF